jgi:hypothetical protein
MIIIITGYARYNDMRLRYMIESGTDYHAPDVRFWARP